ncbi:MAG: biotin/lipoyl-containing protein [Pseudomonadota bacterium]
METKENVHYVRPGMSPGEIVQSVRGLEGIGLTSTGMRDAGQSDYKNRLRLIDLSTLSPFYNRMGLFSAECHGGARWHVGVMNRRESPFDEINRYRELMPDVLLQTLVRETNLWGYRPYSKDIIEHVVREVDIDVWRCFSFLNDISNMREVSEVVMKRGRLFEPSLSFTQADWTTNDYYMGVVGEIVDLCGGTDEIILCIKDMAGVGSPSRIHSLVDAILQKYPEMVVAYHRHSTDGLALPALLAAAQAGAKLLDVQEDSLTRFYGQPPILSLQAYLEEAGIPVHINREQALGAVQQVRSWIGRYDWAESPFKGFDYTVTEHRMPGGAFPSSFEHAEKGNFLQLMPQILEVMSLYNRIIKYFDVTPGSQITWVTCSGIVNRNYNERGNAGVKHVIGLLKKFVVAKEQDFGAMEPVEQEELLELFRGATSDFKNLLVGGYGTLPVGWPADWVYQSAFGVEWEEKLADRDEPAPPRIVANDNLKGLRQSLTDELGRDPTEEEFILYLMHPKDALIMIAFREKFGEAPLTLHTNVWREGLKRAGDTVQLELKGKPYEVQLVSIGAEHEGLIHVVLRVNNKTRVFQIETPHHKASGIRMASTPNQLGSPISGNLWRIGNPARGELKVGDTVHKGEEVANLEAMKMENAILSPFDGKIVEIAAKLNDSVAEGQLLLDIEEVEAS